MPSLNFTDMKERGIVCCFCGKGWGYVGKKPTERVLRVAVDHEKRCPKNPYSARIKLLEKTLKSHGINPP